MRRALDGDRLISVFFKNGRLFFAISFAYLTKLLDFSIDTEYKIVASMSDICYSDVALFYIGSIVVGGWRTVLKKQHANRPTTILPGDVRYNHVTPK